MKHGDHTALIAIKRGDDLDAAELCLALALEWDLTLLDWTAVEIDLPDVVISGLRMGKTQVDARSICHGGCAIVPPRLPIPNYRTVLHRAGRELRGLLPTSTGGVDWLTDLSARIRADRSPWCNAADHSINHANWPRFAQSAGPFVCIIVVDQNLP
jgi:hypothetical protein